MSVVQVGDSAPPVPGASHGVAPRALVFYKVTCPVCQMAAPRVGELDRRFPGRVLGIGQDPTDALTSFSEEYGLVAPSVSDPEPYPTSDAYGIEVVPTLVVVDDGGRVADVVQSWDRDGYNRAAGTLAAMTGGKPVPVSTPEDGLPPFRPG